MYPVEENSAALQSRDEGPVTVNRGIRAADHLLPINSSRLQLVESRLPATYWLVLRLEQRPSRWRLIADGLRTMPTPAEALVAQQRSEHWVPTAPTNHAI